METARWGAQGRGRATPGQCRGVGHETNAAACLNPDPGAPELRPHTPSYMSIASPGATADRAPTAALACRCHLGPLRAHRTPPHRHWDARWVWNAPAPTEPTQPTPSHIPTASPARRQGRGARADQATALPLLPAPSSDPEVAESMPQRKGGAARKGGGTRGRGGEDEQEARNSREVG